MHPRMRETGGGPVVFLLKLFNVYVLLSSGLDQRTEEARSFDFAYIITGILKIFFPLIIQTFLIGSH